MKKNNSSKFNLVNKILPWVLIVSLLGVALYNSLNKFFDEDEFEAIHTAWKMLKGERIYRDFFQHHHPFFYYLLMPLIAISGENTRTVIAIRLFIFLIFILILITSYLLARQVFNKKIALFTLIILTSTPLFIENTMEIRPDVPQTLFGLLSLLFLFIYFNKKSLKYIILSAVSLALAFLLLQKALFLILLVGVLLIYSVLKKEIKIRPLLLYGLIFLIILLPYFFYLGKNNLLGPYWFLNWTLNQNFLNRFSPLITINTLLKTNVLLSIFYVSGIIFLSCTFPESPHQKFWCGDQKDHCLSGSNTPRGKVQDLFFAAQSAQKKLAVLSLGLFLSLFAVHSPYPQYLITAIPLMATVAAYLLGNLYQNNRKSIILILTLSIIISANYLLKGVKNENVNQKDQLEKINYVLSLTDSDDSVYDGDISFNLFRRDIDYFWFSIKPNRGLATYQTIKPYHYDIYELIEKYKPSVISVEYIENREDERIIKKYVQSKIYNDLFIRKDKD